MSSTGAELKKGLTEIRCNTVQRDSVIQATQTKLSHSEGSVGCKLV